MKNRKTGALRFVTKPDLGGLVRALGRLRLPRLSRRNRKKLRLLGDPAAPEAVAPPGVRGPARAPRRHGIAGLVLGVLAFAAPLAAALAAFALPLLGVRAYEYVMDSGYFHVRSVTVDNAQAAPHYSNDQLLELAGIDADTHVLDADLVAMTQRLGADPWIRWAQVERELPDSLVVHVVEHRPSALLAADDLYLVDELGVPFTIAPADLTLALPVISGIAPERLRDPAESAAIARELAVALNISRSWQAHGLARRYPLGELRLMAGGAIAVVLEGKATGMATEIVLGRPPLREKLFRVEWILEHLRSLGAKAEYILLDLGDDRPAPLRSLDIGGARVVVKAELGAELIEHPAPATPGDPAAPAPDHVPNPSPDSAESLEPDADLEGAEAAPISGGRPASESGQE